MSELRFDPFGREWITISARRLGRPVTDAQAFCPFCPAPAGAGPAAIDGSEAPRGDYEVAVFENRFPSFGGPAAPEGGGPAVPGQRTAPGLGRAEIVLYSPRHDVHLATIPEPGVRLLVDVWAERTAALAADPAVDYVFVFENRGRDVGQTIDHPHGQIYGYPFVPPRVARELAHVREHRREEGECLQCAVLQGEERAGARIVDREAGWVALVPFAPHFPFEVHLLPRRHVGSLPDLAAQERAAFARLLRRTVARYDGLHGHPLPYMMCVFGAPHAIPEGDIWHLRVAFQPVERAAGRLKYLAGSESGAGAYLQDATPESMAAALRGVAM